MGKPFSVVGGFQKTKKRDSRNSDEDFYDNRSKKKDRSKRKNIKNNFTMDVDKSFSDNYDDDYDDQYEFVEA